MKKISFISATVVFTCATYAITSPITSNVTIVGEESYNGSLTINSGALLTIGESSSAEGSLILTASGENPLVNDGKIVVSEFGSLAVNRTDSVSWSAASYSGNIDIYGTVSTQYGTGGMEYNGYNLQLKVGNTVNVFDGGTLTFKNGAMGISGVVNLYAGSLTKVQKIVFNGTSYGRLVVMGDNILQNASGGSTLSNVTFGSNISNTRIDLRGNTSFAVESLSLQNIKDVGFVLSDSEDSLISVGKISININNAYTGTEMFVLDNFKNDVFKIEDYSNLSIVDGDKLSVIDGTKTVLFNLSATDAGGTEITLGENEKWVITSDGYLNIVPEPAEWAAAFGALAAAFVSIMGRRRK